MLQFSRLPESRAMDLHMRDSLAEITVARRQMAVAPIFICDRDKKAVMDGETGRLLHPHYGLHPVWMTPG